MQPPSLLSSRCADLRAAEDREGKAHGLFRTRAKRNPALPGGRTGMTEASMGCPASWESCCGWPAKAKQRPCRSRYSGSALPASQAPTVSGCPASVHDRTARRGLRAVLPPGSQPMPRLSRRQDASVLFLVNAFGSMSFSQASILPPCDCARAEIRNIRIAEGEPMAQRGLAWGLAARESGGQRGQRAA